MLITTKNSEGLIRQLNGKGIDDSTIGKIYKKNGILIDENNEIRVESAKRD